MRGVALAGHLTLAGSLVLAAVRFFPAQSWSPAAQLIAIFPLALPLALLALGLLLGARSRRAALLAGGLAIVMTATISLRVVDRVEDTGAATETLAVGAFNAYYGRADVAALTRTVRSLDLDVLCVAEATPAFEAALVEDGLTAYLPAFVSLSEAGASGSVLYSRKPIRQLDSVPGSSFRMPRAVVTTDSGDVTVTCAHPVPPTTGNLGVWSRELRALRDTAAGTESPQGVMGDFNATWDHRLLRRIADRADLVNATHVTGQGLVPTWPVVDGPVPFPFAQIDHVLTDLPVVSAEIIEIPGSDHRLVAAVLSGPG